MASDEAGVITHDLTPEEVGEALSARIFGRRQRMGSGERMGHGPKAGERTPATSGAENASLRPRSRETIRQIGDRRAG